MTFVLANVVWFVLAVLIVPLPAATAGLFAVLLPLVRGTDTEFFATFFGTMRRQWLKSTLIAAADVALGVLIAVNLQVLGVMDPPQGVFWLLRSLYLFVALAVVLINLYAWPLLVLFDLPLRRLFEVALRLAFGHPLWSLITLGLALLPLGTMVVVPPLIGIFGLFSTVVLIINWGAWRIIQRYATPEDFESSI